MKPVVKRAPNLREQVFDAVSGMLRYGELAPGTRVTEEGLARTLDVSRTPIREAVGQLARQGLLVGREGGGYVVPTPTPGQIHEVIAVRLLIEPAAVRMAAAEYGPDELARISRAIAAEAAAVAAVKPGAFARANEEFRRCLFGSISNATLGRLISQFDSHLNFIRAVTLKDTALRRDIVDRQVSVRDAIAKRAGERAERLWRDYLGFTEVVLVRTLQSIQDSHAGNAD